MAPERSRSAWLAVLCAAGLAVFWAASLGSAVIAPSALAAESAVEQYGGGGAGVSSDVAAGGVGGQECVESILNRSRGASPSASADEIVARCQEAIAADAAAASASGGEEADESGLPVTGVDVLFLAVGVMLLVMIGWMISRLVLHQTEAAR